MKKIYLLLLVLILAACGRNGDGEERVYPDVPLMWRATSPDGNSIYLFGTMHLGSPDLFPLPDFIMDAFNRSDYLAVEWNMLAELSQEEQSEEARFLVSLGFYTDGRTIVDCIGADLHERLVDVATQHGFGETAEAFLYAKPWTWYALVVGFPLLETELTGHAFGHGYDVDSHLKREAINRGMPILNVEPRRMAQIVLTTFSTDLVVTMLENSLQNTGTDAHNFRNMYYAWQRGDKEWFLNDWATVLETKGEHAYEFNNAMLTQRDIDMTQVAKGYMTDGKSVFFAVGLYHFLHDESIIQLLIREGYEVVRIYN